MHCENAPCEYVCPVAATVHSSEGLNEMIYNRCVGTRFCSNNCPYKVRRFNFLAFADFDTPTARMQYNPDVSVRSRGVMEKCSYCVQRIRQGEIGAEVAGRSLVDGEVLTACQAVCPTRAIAFGDMNDEQSEVAAWKKSPLHYSLLAELNTEPRTTYMAALRNPHPELEEGGAWRGRHAGTSTLATVRRARGPPRLCAAGRNTAIGHGADQRSRARTPDGPRLAAFHAGRPCAARRVSARGNLSVCDRRRHLGHRYSGRLGFRHNGFRLVDRDRSCRHVDLRHLVAVAPAVADFHQPHCRSDDHLRRDVRRAVSVVAPGPALVLLLAVAISEHHAALAAVPQRAGLGRVRGQHLLHRLADLLVHGHDSRPGDAARPR